jgi:tripartite-type tricarboxylate transporter receptor subunit TctC
LLGIEAEIIPGYKGTNDYIVAAVRGDGQACVATIVTLQQFIRSKMIRVLCTFEEKSSVPGAEDATSLGQPDLLRITQMRPVAAPPGMSKDLAGDLSTRLINAMKDPDVVTWAETNSANMTPDGQDKVKAMIDDQFVFTEKWKKYLI